MPVGEKYDQGKLRWSLLPWEPLEEVVRILMFGEQKYSPAGWKVVPDGHKRYSDALLRHVIQWAKGEQKDPESSYSHLSHMICNALFLLWLEKYPQIPRENIPEGKIE